MSIHSVSNLKPEDYQIIGFLAILDVMTEEASECLWDRMTDALPDNMNYRFYETPPKNLYKGNYQSKGTCDHCGAHCKYFAIFYHTATNEHILTGLDCAANISHNTNYDQAYKVMSIANKGRRTRVTRAAAFATWKLENPQDWDLLNFLSIENDFYQGFQKQLYTYGKLSEAQMACVYKDAAKLVAKETCAHAVEVKPFGAISPNKNRSTVVGTIVGIKEYENDFGFVTKLMVQSGQTKVWVSCPAALGTPERGMGIQFDAALAASADDENFLIGKRPTKPLVLYFRAS